MFLTARAGMTNMSTMATKKKKPVKSKNKFPLWGLRLPPAHKEGIRKAAEQNNRSPTQEVKVAIEAHLRSLGMWPPS